MSEFDSRSVYLSAAASGLCLVGGVAGFALRRSVPSLVGGSIAGGLFGLSSWEMYRNHPMGKKIYGITAAFIGGAMIPKAIKGGKRKFLVFKNSCSGSFGSF